MALAIVSGSFALPKQVHAGILGGYMENDASGNAYSGLPYFGATGVTTADVTAGAALPAAFASNAGSILQAISYAASSTTYEEGPGIDISSQVVKLDFAGSGDSELPAHTLAATSVLAAAVASGATQQFTESALADFLAGTVASTGIAASSGVLAIAGDGSSVQLNGSGLIEVKDDGVSLAKMASIARGSIISGDASGDPQYLTVGAASTFLQSDGTDLAYVAMSGDAELSAGVLTITDNAVSLAKMASIARGSIISGDASGDPQYLTVGAASTFLQSDGTDLAYVAMSGDATLSAGALSIGALKVTNAMLAGSIANAKLVNDSVTVTGTSGLSGGGEVDLGASTSLTLDVANANTWTGVQKFDTDVLQIEGTNAGGEADKYFAMKVEGGILVLTQQA